MSVKVCGSAVFSLEAPTISVGAKATADVGFHRIGYSDTVLKGRYSRTEVAWKNEGRSQMLQSWRRLLVVAEDGHGKTEAFSPHACSQTSRHHIRYQEAMQNHSLNPHNDWGKTCKPT